MRTLSLALAILAATAACAAQSEPQPAKEIHAKGCVQSGVEAGCLVLKDVDSGKLYTLLVRGQGRPAIGSGIEFTGTPFRGMSACMQGALVTVSHWQTDKSLECHAQPAPQE